MLVLEPNRTIRLCLGTYTGPHYILGIKRSINGLARIQLLQVERLRELGQLEQALSKPSAYTHDLFMSMNQISFDWLEKHLEAIPELYELGAIKIMAFGITPYFTGV